MKSLPPERRRRVLAPAALACGSGAAPAPRAERPACRARVVPAPMPLQRDGHPNAFDLARIERLLAQRSRYRYVSPLVRAVPGGYEVASPNCSRNVDAHGGVILVARLRFDPVLGWRLFHRDHAAGRWQPDGDHRRLGEAIARLNQDPQRCFWP